MSDREVCGDFEVYFDDGWWVVKRISTGTIFGKFISHEDAMDKVALIMQDEGDETESVC